MNKNPSQVTTIISRHVKTGCAEDFESWSKKIPPHIWMGVSVEDEDHVWRIDELRRVIATPDSSVLNL